MLGNNMPRAPLGELSLNASASQREQSVKQLEVELSTAATHASVRQRDERHESSAASEASSQPSEVEKQHLLRASRAALRRFHSSEAARARLQVDWGHTQVGISERCQRHTPCTARHRAHLSRVCRTS